MKTLYLTQALLCVAVTSALAQDPQFTQFYAAPLYHNPAFAGSTHQGRAVMNVRDQWPSIPGAFVTVAASVDNYFKRYNSGAGINMSVDRAGSGKLCSINLGAVYAYEMEISRTWAFRAGFEFAYRQRSIDFYKLIWRDQLSSNGTAQNTHTSGEFANNSVSAFDVSSGGLLYSKRFWLGLSSAHMNQPNQNLTSDVSRLPIRWTVQSGYNIPLSSHRAGRYNNNEVVTTLTPAILYKQQAGFRQVDVGAYLNIEPLIIGAWYRGIPVIKNANGYPSQDALAFLIGVKTPVVSVGYSYDLTISGLGPGTGGAHELSVSYQFPTAGNGKRRHVAIPCPKF